MVTKHPEEWGLGLFTTRVCKVLRLRKMAVLNLVQQFPWVYGKIDYYDGSRTPAVHL